MSSKHTKATAARSGDLTISQVTSDSPLLPIDHIERLQASLPHRAEWVFEQTQAEAQARRSESRRINTFIFVEQMVRLASALIIGLAGLGAAVYCAVIGQSTAAAVIGGTTVVGLVTAFVVSTKARRNAG